MRRYGRQVAVLITLAVMSLCACTGGQTVQGYPARTGGDAQRGKQVIMNYRCGACHTIPEIRDANGVFAPPLLYFSRRIYIAGELPNTPQNVVRWVTSPPSVKPQPAMPVLGLTPEQARDVAAYLYTLR